MSLYGRTATMGRPTVEEAVAFWMLADQQVNDHARKYIQGLKQKETLLRSAEELRARNAGVLGRLVPNPGDLRHLVLQVRNEAVRLLRLERDGVGELRVGLLEAEWTEALDWPEEPAAEATAATAEKKGEPDGPAAPCDCPECRPVVVMGFRLGGTRA
jgi:hypothetical protein